MEQLRSGSRCQFFYAVYSAGDHELSVVAPKFGNATNKRRLFLPFANGLRLDVANFESSRDSNGIAVEQIINRVNANFGQPFRRSRPNRRRLFDVI